MFEDKTFENLLNSKLADIDSKYDKREGSMIYDALAPNSAEDAQTYITLDWMYNQQHGETANRENLIMIAKDTRGLEPRAATYAILKGVFNCAVEIGSRFSLSDLNYVVLDLIDDTEHTYKLQCETVGTIGNNYLGTIIPIQHIRDLTSAEVTEVLIYGEDEEETETFRERWRNAFSAGTFGGNKESYRIEIKKIDGVGGVKVERTMNETGEKVGGYVRCTIISSAYTVPSAELIETVQTIIDPKVNQGDGDGMAPIGAIANIVPVGGVEISISATITYDTGYSFDALKSQIDSAIDTYFSELCKSWEDNGDSTMVVRVARIESAILDVEGVLDITGTKLNGVESNVVLDMYSIPVRGEING